MPQQDGRSPGRPGAWGCLFITYDLAGGSVDMPLHSMTDNPDWFSSVTFFSQPSKTKEHPFGRWQQFVIFPGFPIDFLVKPAGKFANANHMIAGQLAISYKCKWIAKYPDCYHMTAKMLQGLWLLSSKSLFQCPCNFQHSLINSNI